MKTDDGYIRQNNNKGSVLNTDNKAAELYKAKRSKYNEINTIKEEMQEIKSLLKQLLEKNK